VIVYLDTSAFVKLVLNEVAADAARSWFERSRPAITSVVTYPEACSALKRRSIEAASSDAPLETWLTVLDARWRRVVAVEAAARPAGAMALKHALRGMDALQLGTAIRVRERLEQQGAEEPLVFASFDRRLLEAAEREGFATLGGPLG
jgi:predicted nucleic acid-binding protein